MFIKTLEHTDKKYTYSYFSKKVDILNLRHFKWTMQGSAKANKAATFCYSFFGYCA